jgi:hypothetical protein
MDACVALPNPCTGCDSQQLSSRVIIACNILIYIYWDWDPTSLTTHSRVGS